MSAWVRQRVESWKYAPSQPIHTYCAPCNIANFADITRDTNKYGMLWCNVNVVEHELATIKHCRMIAMVAKKNNLYAIDDRIRWLWNIDGCTGITAINKKWLGHSSCCVSFFWCCVLLCPIAFVSLWTISFPEREKYTRYHIHNLSLFIGCAMR